MTDSPKRRICVVTGSRADYGLLKWLMADIQADPRLELIVAATGMHLSPEFGLTIGEILGDGFVVRERVEMLLSSDTPAGIAKSVGIGTMGFADAFSRLEPDLVVLVGDRFEILAAAQAAMLLTLPIAHLYGGEVTEGAVDESIRHVITKMSHLHFTTATVHRDRVIQLGENPAHVFDFGAPGLDIVRRGKFLSREELGRSIGFNFGPKNFLVTYHPVTLGLQGPREALRALFAALDRFPEARVLFTRPNADAEGRIIARTIDEYCAESEGRALAVTSLGQLRYLSAVQACDVVIGNSSSGLIEVPAFQKPTVNLGDRQKGRLRGASVIDCAETPDAISAAITQALSPEFTATLTGTRSPYGDGTASARIKDVLATADLAALRRKPFYDLPGAAR
jgi:UDP-N-acetylglucosamine 2-epimerase (non-hydrolysing)/GDP/UDP-N,N'-diacetylbacillosamine 2-epimerase (hydrolysing)